MADTFRVDPKKLAPYTSSAFRDTLGRLFTSGIFMGELNSFDIDNTVGGLNFKVKTGRALINGVFVELGALSDTKSMPASSTRHVYIALTQDASSPPKPTGATIEILTGTPTTPYVQIATLISGASTITTVNQSMRLAVTNLPSGLINMFAGDFSAIPLGWIGCIGTSHLRNSYPNLYSVVGSKFGTPKALVLNNSTYVTMPNESKYDFERTNPFSIAFWVYDAGGASYDVILAKTTTVFGGSAGYNIIRGTDANQTIHFQIFGSTQTIIVSATDGSIPLNTWKHVVFTYDGSSNQNGMRIYIDGTLSATGTSATISQSILNNNNLVIGATSSGANIFNGRIDDVRIYGRELSASDVSKLYAGEIPPTPIMALDFNDNVVDSIAGDIGTVTGSASYVERTDMFRIPNLSERFPRGAGFAKNPGTMGGADSVVLTMAQMPAHNHNLNDPGHQHNVLDQASSNATGTGNPVRTSGSTLSSLNTTGITLQTQGNNEAHENRPAFTELLYIIKT